MLSHTAIIVLLGFALVACIYLLVLLWQIHEFHRSTAWKYIFLGLTLLTVEIVMALYLSLYPSSRWGPIIRSAFIITVVAKSFLYAVGFTIWKNNIAALRKLARKIPKELVDEDVQKIIGTKEEKEKEDER